MDRGLIFSFVLANASDIRTRYNRDRDQRFVRFTFTELGTLTDGEGSFHIYALDPGYYAVTARMVGMTAVTKEGVRGISDQSTRVDFALDVEAAGSTVIEVRDQRSMILETVPSTIYVIDRAEMDRMPVPDLLGIIDRQSGVVTIGGVLHVRGGRAG